MTHYMKLHIMCIAYYVQVSLRIYRRDLLLDSILSIKISIFIRLIKYCIFHVVFY